MLLSVKLQMWVFSDQKSAFDMWRKKNEERRKCDDDLTVDVQFVALLSAARHTRHPAGVVAAV